jgi:hypothetical protein
MAHNILRQVAVENDIYALKDGAETNEVQDLGNFWLVLNNHTLNKKNLILYYQVFHIIPLLG